jgi:hypothetical protein
MDDSDLIVAFEAGTLAAADFRHERHVRVAWGLQRRYGRAEGLRRMAAGIRAMADRAGHPEKYHVTVTRAWFELVAGADEVRDDSDLFDRTLLTRYYTPERLKAGRERWVEPDLCPLTLPATSGAPR